MDILIKDFSARDQEVAAVLKIISYFDDFSRHPVSVGRIAEAAARLAQCPVGVELARAEVRIRALPDGTVAPLGARSPRPTRRVTFRGGQVWLERDTEEAAVLDMLLLERLALAVGTSSPPLTEAVLATDEQGLVEVAVSEAAGETDRLRALRLLGFSSDSAVRVLVAATPDAAELDLLLKQLSESSSPARWASIGEMTVVIVGADTSPPSAVRVPRLGVGRAVPPVLVAESLETARTALRFTVPHPHRNQVVTWDELGPLALIATHVPVSAIAELPDVRAMRLLGSAVRGRELVETVEALCTEGSLRRTAAAMHLHHSSTAARIARAETVFGFGLDTQVGRSRAQLALWLARLLPPPGDADDQVPRAVGHC